jgi:hypothetical protein
MKALRVSSKEECEEEVLAGRDGFDGEPADEIPGGIEYGFGVELPLGSSADSASMRN